MEQTGENWTTAARHHDATHTSAAAPARGKHPSRVVDRHGQGWYQVAGPDRTATQYEASCGWKRGLQNLEWDALLAARGPLRPVLPITDAGHAELRRLLAAAARRAITTLAAALARVFDDLVTRYDSLENAAAWDAARRHLLAGREGSWEADLLMEIVFFGRELNNAVAVKDHQPGEPGYGPSKRVDVNVRDQLAALILRWVSDPEWFTEVAETLAAAVSGYCDAAAGPDGWRVVAD